MAKEFKIIKTTHAYSERYEKVAYAIVTTTYLTAEPDAKIGAYLSKEDDMFIIANSISEAIELLKQATTFGVVI